jgi:large repetitive protein
MTARRGISKTKPQRTSNPRLALEPRIVFDGAGGASAADAYSIDVIERHQQLSLFVPPAVREAVSVVKRTAESPASAPASTQSNDDPIKDSNPAAPTDASANLESTGSESLKATATVTSQSTEIIFIDASVQDVRAFLSGKSGEVIILDANRDGVEQIAQALAGRTNVTAVHVLGHGEAGQLRLGNATLSQASMAGEHADELVTIKAALSVNADLLIYGCNFGEGELGRVTTDALAVATGADVASSVDVTGHRDLGGNWVLERQTGSIEADLVLDKEGQDQYWGALTLIAPGAPPVITAGPGSTLVGTVLTPNTSPVGTVVGHRHIWRLHRGA